MSRKLILDEDSDSNSSISLSETYDLVDDFPGDSGSEDSGSGSGNEDDIHTHLMELSMFQSAKPIPLNLPRPPEISTLKLGLLASLFSVFIALLSASLHYLSTDVIVPEAPILSNHTSAMVPYNPFPFQFCQRQEKNVPKRPFWRAFIPPDHAVEHWTIEWLKTESNSMKRKPFFESLRLETNNLSGKLSITGKSIRGKLSIASKSIREQLTIVSTRSSEMLRIGMSALKKSFETFSRKNLSGFKRSVAGFTTKFARSISKCKKRVQKFIDEAIVDIPKINT
jgi:hypothetical protein